MDHDSSHGGESSQKKFRDKASILLFDAVLDDKYTFPNFSEEPDIKHLPQEILIWALTVSEPDAGIEKTVECLLSHINYCKCCDLNIQPVIFSFSTRYGGKPVIEYCKKSADIFIGINFDKVPRTLDIWTRSDTSGGISVKVSDQQEASNKHPRPPFKFDEFPSVAARRLFQPGVSIGERYLAALWTDNKVEQTKVHDEVKKCADSLASFVGFKDRDGFSINAHRQYIIDATTSFPGKDGEREELISFWRAR